MPDPLGIDVREHFEPGCDQDRFWACDTFVTAALKPGLRAPAVEVRVFLAKVTKVAFSLPVTSAVLNAESEATLRALTTEMNDRFGKE